MIGRPYSPTDVDNEFDRIQYLGYPVRAEVEGEEITGTLANVTADGMATIVDYRDIVVAVIPADTVYPNLSQSW